MNQVALYEITSQHNDIVVINQPVFSANTGLDWLPSVPSLWQIVRFKNLFCVIYRYPTYFNIEYVPEGVPEVRGEALTSDGYIEKLVDERYISHETNSLFPMTQLQIGDIVMSVRGTMGKIGIVDERYAGANITANLLRLSPDKNRVGGEFLRWLMQSNYFNESLNSSAPQTTIKTRLFMGFKDLALTRGRNTRGSNCYLDNRFLQSILSQKQLLCLN